MKEKRGELAEAGEKPGDLNRSVRVGGDVKIDMEPASKESAPGSGSRTVLLAPSWGESSILNKYGESIMEALLATDYHIIVRPHPQSIVSEKGILDRLIKRYEGNGRVEWNLDRDNFDVLSRSDVMISDYSGVVYDFALVFDRPVIYADTSFDPAPYDAAWTDEKLWRFQVLEKFGIRLDSADFGRMQEVLDGAVADETLGRARAQVRAEVWQNPGHAAEKIVRYLIDKKRELAA